MSKLPFLVFLIIFLSSCSLSGGNKKIEISIGESPMVSTGFTLPPGAEVIALSGSERMEAIPVTSDVGRMIEIEKQGGSTGVLAVDCNSFDKEGKEYCILQKEKIEFAIKTTITWEGAIKKGVPFISTMDCTTIYSDVGQKYCQEYQAGLKKK